MTRNEAYRILGIARTSGSDQIEEAYKTLLSKCQLQLVPGQSLATRQEAQDRIVAIQDAWQVLKNQTPRNITSHPVNTQHTRVNYFGWLVLFRISPRTAGFFVAIVLMGSISLLCMHSSGHTAKANTPNFAASGPVIPSNSSKAHLMILAVPWCYVEIDDKFVGTSGQSAAFEVSKGIHTLVLRSNGKVLAKTVSLNGGYLTVIKIDFERGLIRVEQE